MKKFKFVGYTPDLADVMIFVFFFVIASILTFRYQLILLGASLIILGPILISERLVVNPKYYKVVVVFGILSVFIGGYIWNYAFRL